jgi:LemA protein
MMFGYKPKPNFSVENEAAISKPPSVEFGNPAAGTPPAASAVPAH